MKQSMLAVGVLTIVLASPSALSAQERPNSLAMTCAQATGLVRSQGAVVVGSGPSLYDRYVENRGYCTPMQYVEPAWVPTRDAPSCQIGYLCREPTLEFNR